jgi:hypothetical protein
LIWAHRDAFENWGLSYNRESPSPGNWFWGGDVGEFLRAWGKWGQFSFVLDRSGTVDGRVVRAFQWAGLREYLG